MTESGQGIETVTNVPFTFTAGDTKLPQDRYRISPMPGQNNVFMVRGERHGVVLMSRIDCLNDCEPAPSLTFHRYGDQYSSAKCSSGWKDSAPHAVACGFKFSEYVAAQAAAKSTVVVASNVPK